MDTVQLAALANSGQIDGTSHLRSLIWRIFLKCISEDSTKWLQEISAERQGYTQLHTKYLSVSHQSAKVDDEHPLASDHGSQWSQRFQDEELKKLIMQDVERTFPDYDFFRRTENQRVLLNVLFFIL